MTNEELKSQHNDFNTHLSNKDNAPFWYDINTRTPLSRGITVEVWNNVIRLLTNVASDTNTTVEFVKALYQYISDINVNLTQGLVSEEKVKEMIATAKTEAMEEVNDLVEEALADGGCIKEAIDTAIETAIGSVLDEGV